MANLKNTTIDGTVFQLPSGDTAAQPTGTNGAQLRFNTETGQLEQFRPGLGAWIAPSNTGVIATGGDAVYDVETEGTTYRVHVFTSTGTSTFSVLQGGGAEYLIVAGGGGGGTHDFTTGSNPGCGGGGAGGLIESSATVTANSYNIVVGAGGRKGIADQADSESRGRNGSDSSAFGETAIGGGGGSGRNDRDGGYPGLPGGSGGGRSSQNGTSSRISGTSGQGNDGGVTGGNGSYGGGGGGAGQVGGDSDGGVPGNGGDGISSSITGTSTFYAGGGAGGIRSSQSGTALGGAGGGGDEPGQNGTANTGGGGGGHAENDGGNGGSGIVIIRYPLRQNNPETAAGQDVRNGLVLDLDFAKPTVYSGSGSVVTDSRLNGIKGSFSSTPVFINPRSHRSAFDLDENNADIRFPNQYMSTQNASNVSYSFWIYNDWSNKTGYETVLGIQQSSFDRVATLALNSGDNGIISFDLRTSTNVRNRDVVTTDLKSFSNQWLYIVHTFDTGTHRLYLNGVLEVTESRSITSFPSWTQSGGGFAIGDNLGSSRQHGGIFGDVKIFTKTLEQIEIDNIFNATRWRFGV